MSPAIEPKTLQTLLLEIFERLGGIDAKLEAGQLTHDEFRADIKELKAQSAKFDKAAAVVDGMKPIVDDYQKSKYKAAGVMLAITTISTGFGASLGFIGSKIKDAIFPG